MDSPHVPTRPGRVTRASNRNVSYVDAFVTRKRRRPTTSAPRPKRRKTALAASEATAHEEEIAEVGIGLSARGTSEATKDYVLVSLEQTLDESMSAKEAKKEAKKEVEGGQRTKITSKVTHESEESSGVSLGGPLHPHQIFRFMDLPAELRLHIYRMSLQRETPLLLHLPRPSTNDNDCEGRLLENHITDRFPRGRHNAIGEECVTPAILMLNQQVYKEARQILYGDNTFVLSLTSGIHTLSHLHQRSRSLIKSVSLTIPNHHDILDNFADVVRLGLRYCWGLRNLTIVLPMVVPEGGYLHSTTSIYSNAFHILRWLPKGGKVQLEGTGVSGSIRKVVEEEGLLMVELDETNYLKRQHQMPERH